MFNFRGLVSYIRVGNDGGRLFGKWKDTRHIVLIRSTSTSIVTDIDSLRFTSVSANPI